MWPLKSYRLVDALVILLLLVFSFLMWWPTRYLPFHWDGAGFVATAMENLNKTHFFPFTITGSDFAHPPLLITLLALVWQFSHRSLLALHLVLLPFLPILLISSYYLGKKIVNQPSGIMIAFLVGLSPVVLAELGDIYLDLPMAALCCLALSLWLYRHPRSALITLTLSVLIKANAIVILPFFFLVKIRDHRHRFTAKDIYWLLLPVFSLLIWFVYHRLVTGWFLVDPQAQILHRMALTPSEFYQSVIYIGQSFLIDQNRLYITLTALLAGGLLFLGYLKRPSVLPQLNLFWWLLMTLSLGLLYFIVVAEFSPRYAIFLLPIFYTLTFWLLDRLSLVYPSVITTSTVLLAFLIFGSFSLLSWYPPATAPSVYNFRPPSDLGYIDMIRVFQKLSVYLQINEPESHIYGSFPENLYLTDSSLKYVSSPLLFSLCDDFHQEPSVRQLVVMHAYSPGQLMCRQLMDAYTLKPLTRFSENDKWVELYAVESSQSAQAVN